MALKITILGCGSSGGVPRIGGDWGACDPKEPKNRRTRCSILLEKTRDGQKGRTPKGKTHVLVDSSPDFYGQMFGRKIQWLDGVLYTHHHADQTHGINDLRAFFLNRLQPVPVYMDDECANVLKKSFHYGFEPIKGSGYPQFLEHHPIKAGKEITIHGDGGDIQALPFTVNHGPINALAFRFGSIAYSPDVVDIDEIGFAILQNLDCWIVDALRYTPHPTHAHLEKTLHWIEKVKPKQAILTNMHIDLDYQSLKQSLPPHILPGFDNMEIQIQ